MVIAADEIVNALPVRRQRRVVRTVAAAIAVLLLLGSFRGWLWYRNANAALRDGFALDLGNAKERWEIELASWMRTHLPPGSRVVVSDSPGEIAYFSGLDVLTVDGLMSDYQYEKDILRLGPTAYFAQHSFAFYVGPRQTHAGSIQSQVVDAPLYRRPAGRLSLDDARIVVTLRDLTLDGTLPDWAVWRL